MRVILLILCLFMASPSYASNIKTSDHKFLDETRDRPVPYRLYEPAHQDRPSPVVIFSHGLGGSIKAAPHFCKGLAEAGYFVFSIQHAGSDSSIWQGMGTTNREQVSAKLAKSTKDLDAYVNRMKDVSFVLDQIELLNQSGALKGKLDTNKIGIAGHSYGAKTVLASSGQKNFRGNSRFKDSRIKAGIALSPNVPSQVKDLQSSSAKTIFSGITIPMFYVTGTKDSNPVKGGDLKETVERRIAAYSLSSGPDKYLLVLKDADHGSLGAKNIRDNLTRHITDSISEGSVLFFDAYLKGDSTALNMLQNSYAKSLAQHDRFEYK